MKATITRLTSAEEAFAQERAEEAWKDIQGKLIGVGLEAEIVKIIKREISFGMLRVKADLHQSDRPVCLTCGKPVAIVGGHWMHLEQDRSHPVKIVPDAPKPNVTGI